MIALLLGCADAEDPIAFTPTWYAAEVVCEDNGEGAILARWTPPTDTVWITSRYDAHGEDGNWFTYFGEGYTLNQYDEIEMGCNGGDAGTAVQVLYAVGSLEVSE